MPSAVAELYAPLIERQLDAIPDAIRSFRTSNSSDDLFTAVARFAVLAFAPTQHAKHALLSVVAAHDLRDETGDRWDALLCECATYIAQSRLPWSEPPILDPPPVDASQRRELDELREAVQAHDRLRGERWLAARLHDADLVRDLFVVAAEDSSDFGHKLIVSVAASRLSEILGEKGRFAALRVAIWELVSYSGGEPVGELHLPSLIDECIREKGSIESAHRVFLFDAMQQARVGTPALHTGSLPPVYRLARDYGQCLKAHAVGKRLRAQFPDAPVDDFVAACHYNLEHSPSFEDWSFA